MRVSTLWGLAALALPPFAFLCACGGSIGNQSPWDDAGDPSSSGATTGGLDSGGVQVGTGTPNDDASMRLGINDSGPPRPDTGVGVPPTPTMANQTVLTPDCQGCVFPPLGAPACPSSAPPITVVYPSDNVLIPPNMGIISVQWKPSGAPYTTFEVDFSSPPNTDWRIITTCRNYQTTDMQLANQPGTGGCDLPIQGASWAYLAAANRGGNPVQVTVRGSTDGTCASVSNTINVSFASEDLLGTYYYWKSTVSQNGTGGQIWKKLFGDLVNPEQDVTSAAIPAATCNGCHSLSRDGTRMVVNSDDDDSDDEYNDVAGSYLDMTTTPATEFAGGVTGIRQGGQPPGFSTINPIVTSATSPTSPGYYVTSNGFPCVAAGAGGGACGSSNGYPTAVPTNGWSVWNGTTGAFVGGATIGAATTRPTMPDWSPDGTTVVYVVPVGEFTSWRQDDAHIYGGSLYTVPYTGNGMFGGPAVFLQSSGENNYYPSYSPDVPMSYIIFNRTPNANAAGACSGGFCRDDSFSNPAARLFLIGATASGGTPIDLEKANGSPAASPIPWSNSYPRWAPFVQHYKGNKLLWFTFSSTRDYGLRILNHKTGMYQCYPADAAETPGASHGKSFAPQCQEPQLWMAPLTLTENATNKDPSFPAFWMPYQDMTTHNHTAQWTQQAPPPPPPPPDAGTCTCSQVNGPCGAANACGCCSPSTMPPGPSGLTCSGSDTCISPPT